MNAQVATPREDGIKRALEHAGRIWASDALTYLERFAIEHQIFSGEDVSDAHIAAALPQPPDLRAWGGVYRRAVVLGLIRHQDNNGWSRRRGSPCPRYQSLIFRDKAA